jgi:hypothetical protein
MKPGNRAIGRKTRAGFRSEKEQFGGCCLRVMREYVSAVAAVEDAIDQSLRSCDEGQERPGGGLKENNKKKRGGRKAGRLTARASETARGRCSRRHAKGLRKKKVVKRNEMGSGWMLVEEGKGRGWTSDSLFSSLARPRQCDWG